MSETNVFQLCQPGSFIDPLTEVLRDGARTLPAQGVEADGQPYSAGIRQRLWSLPRYSRMAASLPDYGPACRMINERDSFIGQL